MGFNSAFKGLISGCTNFPITLKPTQNYRQQADTKWVPYWRPAILGPTIQKFVTMVTWHLGFVQWSNANAQVDPVRMTVIYILLRNWPMCCRVSTQNRKLIKLFAFFNQLIMKLDVMSSRFKFLCIIFSEEITRNSRGFCDMLLAQRNPCHHQSHKSVDSSWNVMAHGDARRGSEGGNW